MKLIEKAGLKKNICENMRRLNLGCGKDYKEGWVNLDISKSVKADIYADLEKPFPFVNDFFDVVLANDVIEHVANPLVFCEEVWRVLKPGGVFEFKTPYGTHVNGFHICHKCFLTPKSFEMFFEGTKRFSKWDYETKARFRKDFFKVKFVFLKFWFPEKIQYVNLFVDIISSFKGKFIAIKKE